MSNKTVPIGELVEEYSVRAKSIADYSSFEFYGVSNEAGITKSKYAAESKAEEYKIIEKGCFAYNPYRINVGSIAYFDKDERGFISPAYIVFKTKQESIIPELLLKFLKSTEGLRQIKLHARGTVRQALRFEDLCTIKITIPSYEEQISLYKKVTAVEKETITLNEEINNQLDIVSQLRQAFLREAMQGKLTESWRNSILERHPDRSEGSIVLEDGTIYEPASELLKHIKAEKEKLIAEGKIKKDKSLLPIKHEEIPYDIPKTWAWCRISEITINKDEFRIPITREERNKKKKIYDYYGASGIIDKIDGFTHDGDFLLIGEDGANLVTRSTPIAFIARGKFWVNNHAHVLSTIHETTLTYLCYYINSINLKTYITGGFQPKLSQANLEIILIAFPPLTEQQRIVSKLNELMQFCDQLEQNINTTKEQTNLLLQSVLREALELKE